MFLLSRSFKRALEDISPAIIYSHRPSMPYLGWAQTRLYTHTHTYVHTYSTSYTLYCPQEAKITWPKTNLRPSLMPDLWWLYFMNILINFLYLAPSCSTEHSTERGYAWHPGGRLPMLPAGTLHGPNIHLQGLPVLTPPGPGNHREEGWPHWHASG